MGVMNINALLSAVVTVPQRDMQIGSRSLPVVLASQMITSSPSSIIAVQAEGPFPDLGLCRGCFCIVLVQHAG